MVTSTRQPQRHECGCPVSFRDCHVNGDLEREIRWVAVRTPFGEVAVADYQCPKHGPDAQARKTTPA